MTCVNPLNTTVNFQGTNTELIPLKCPSLLEILCDLDVVHYTYIKCV